MALYKWFVTVWFGTQLVEKDLEFIPNYVLWIDKVTVYTLPRYLCYEWVVTTRHRRALNGTIFVPFYLYNSWTGKMWLFVSNVSFDQFFRIKVKLWSPKLLWILYLWGVYCRSTFGCVFIINLIQVHWSLSLMNFHDS